MAQAPELTAIEKQWIKKSLETMRNVLMRSRGKEVVGGEIWVLRGKEVDALNVLIGRFS